MAAARSVVLTVSMHSRGFTRVGFQFQATAFNFGKIQNIVDDREERVAAAFHGVQVFVNAPGEVGLEQELEGIR
jgi:hypothetical protein